MTNKQQREQILDQMEVTKRSRSKTTTYEIVDGRTHDGFSRRLLKLEHEVFASGSYVDEFTESTDHTPIIYVARVFNYKILGGIDFDDRHGHYELIGHYLNGNVVNGKKLSPEIMARLVNSALPKRVKRTLGLEGKL